MAYWNGSKLEEVELEEVPSVFWWQPPPSPAGHWSGWRQPTSSIVLLASFVVSRFLLVWPELVLPGPGNCPTWRQSDHLLVISAPGYPLRSLPLQADETQYLVTLLSQQCTVEISEEKAGLQVPTARHQLKPPGRHTQMKCLSTEPDTPEL